MDSYVWYFWYNMAVEIDLMGGTHGNEILGTTLALLLEDGGYEDAYKIPGVRTYVANRGAAPLATRFLGNREMMGCYTPHK